MKKHSYTRGTWGVRLLRLLALAAALVLLCAALGSYAIAAPGDEPDATGTTVTGDTTGTGTTGTDGTTVTGTTPTNPAGTGTGTDAPADGEDGEEE